MRWLLAVLLVPALAGCVTDADRATEPAPLTVKEAEAMARTSEQVPAEAVLAQATAHVPVAAPNVIAGRASAWTLTYLQGEGLLVAEVAGSEVSVTPMPIEEEDLDSPFYPCPVVLDADSDAIAAALVATPQWQFVWQESRPAEWAGASDPLTASMDLDCMSGTSKWHVNTPFMDNGDDSMSVRMFLLDVHGKLATFTGSEANGMSSAGPTGLGVEQSRIFPAWETGQGSGTTTFETNSVVRLALRADFGSQIGPLPAYAVTLDVIDPAGDKHQLAWDTGVTGQTSATLFLESVAPAAAHGIWTISARTSSPWGLGGIMLTFCSGLPFERDAQFPVCDPLIVAR